MQGPLRRNHDSFSFYLETKIRALKATVRMEQELRQEIHRVIEAASNPGHPHSAVLRAMMALDPHFAELAEDFACELEQQERKAVSEAVSGKQP